MNRFKFLLIFLLLTTILASCGTKNVEANCVEKCDSTVVTLDTVPIDTTWEQ